MSTMNGSTTDKYKALRAPHIKDSAGWCAYCDASWPCLTVQALDELEALRAFFGELFGALSSNVLQDAQLLELDTRVKLDGVLVELAALRAALLHIAYTEEGGAREMRQDAIDAIGKQF